ncbi:MAG: U32 family peptidase [Dehalococcoidia bacterium]|nr:U32 family peptidase [Dehalococcoidia bacterium]
MKKIELLAPARNIETGIVAVNCGADAVYIGAEQFGARAGAENGLNEIEKLAAYAHRYYARVYVALNTILRDEELPQALRLAHQLCDIGVDALIVQDAGLLELPLPPLPLIASTQMHNSTPEKVRFLEQVGFQRVILARELTLEQIRDIRSQTSVELEAFVHGALCVSYSGRCYLSYAIGGRSGNRGQCAQPCRKEYQLRDSKGKTVTDSCHLLSLKDLNRSDYLSDLIDAGITSFKIEGRLKDAAYVANIVGFYRQRLDALLDGTSLVRGSSGKSVFTFTPNPYKTFNRGYISYGMDGNEPSLAARYTPKSLGERIGVVQRISQNYFVLSDPHDLASGDGICFLDAGNQLCGTAINSVQGDRVYPEKMESLKKGAEVWRNHDHQFVKILDGKPTERTIEVNMTISETKSGFRLTIRDEDDNEAEFEVPDHKEVAEKKAESFATIRRQLAKLGNTPFRSKRVQIDLEKPYFLPVSLLNQLRRGACDRLLEMREANRPRTWRWMFPNGVPCPDAELDFTENVLNQKAQAFYRRHGATVTEPAAESGLDMEGRKVMTTRYCIKKELGLCGTSKAESGITEPLYLEDENGRRLFLEFNCESCGMSVYFGRPKRRRARSPRSSRRVPAET